MMGLYRIVNSIHSEYTRSINDSMYDIHMNGRWHPSFDINRIDSIAMHDLPVRPHSSYKTSISNIIDIDNNNKLIDAINRSSLQESVDNSIDQSKLISIVCIHLIYRY